MYKFNCILVKGFLFYMLILLFNKIYINIYIKNYTIDYFFILLYVCLSPKNKNKLFYCNNILKERDIEDIFFFPCLSITWTISTCTKIIERSIEIFDRNMKNYEHLYICNVPMGYFEENSNEERMGKSLKDESLFKTYCYWNYKFLLRRPCRRVKRSERAELLLAVLLEWTRLSLAPTVDLILARIRQRMVVLPK